MIKNLDLINECKKSSIEKACNHVKEFPFVKSMIIFGSSVRDDCTEESDVDICLKILSDVNGLDYYKMSEPLKNIFDGVCDVLIYHKINGKIKDEIDKKGVTVYESE